MMSAMALVASSLAALAQDAPAESIPYCPELKQVTNLALTRERFAPIIGKPREGNFRDTSLPLRGWKDCSFYGPTNYTCDSQGLKTAEEAAEAQAKIARQILTCLGTTWSEATDRSSPGYIVLHPALGPASITLNLDQTDQKDHVVRLTLFLRRN